MAEVRQLPPDPDLVPETPPTTPRQRAGLLLIVLGLACILWGVFHVLNTIGGYEERDFAHRKRDYEVRSVVHESFPGGFYRAMGGLVLLVIGGRLRAGGAENRTDS